MEKSHFELDKSRQHDLLYLYPVLFRESIYALAYDQGLYINRLQNAVYDNKSSLLIVKRLITRMYQQNYFLFYPNDSNNIFVGGYNKNLYFQRLAGGVEVIVQIPFSLRFVSFFLGGSKILKGGSEILKSYNLGSVQSYNLGSVHSIFPFLEDKFPYLNYMLDVQIPYPINLELLVQTLRYYLKDIYFFHLLRLFLHQYFDWDRNSLLFFPNNYKWIYNSKGPSDLSKPNPRLFLFLFHFYIFEYESIFLFLRKKSSHLRLTSFRVFFERIDFYGKMEHLGKVFANDFPVTLWLFKEPFMHYVRFKTKFVLSSKSSFLFMNKWKYFFINFWQLHFCFWSNPRRIRLNQLYEYSFEFLCYYLSVQLNLSVVRSQMLENSFLISSVIKKLDTTFPMVPLIRSLNKLKYCNALGQPISKPFLTDLSDFYIIYRFARLYRDLSYYYSGSSKKKNLYQIKYIFQLSCIKTLALKHKSSARVLLKKRLGSELLQEFFTEEEEEILSLIFPRTSSTLRRLYRGRVWFLDILCIYFHFYCAK